MRVLARQRGRRGMAGKQILANVIRHEMTPGDQVLAGFDERLKAGQMTSEEFD